MADDGTRDHPGVRIVKGDDGCELRWKDARSGRGRRLSLDRLGVETERARTAFAALRSRVLAAERAAARRETKAVPIVRAVEEHLAARALEVGPRTVALDGEVLPFFLIWCEREGVETTADLSPERLERFREYIVTRRKTVRGQGRGHGSRRETASPIAPSTRNTLLAHTKVFLTKCWRLGCLDGLDLDLIRDRLRPVRIARKRPVFLRPDEVRALLAAAIAAGVDRGSPLLAPFVLVMLLCGFRLSEGRCLEWGEVDLEAGEIQLGAGKTKTGRSRAVTLAESPAVIALLGALRERNGEGRYVFGSAEPLSVLEGDRARSAMIRFGAPRFTWPVLRKTCGTYLTCAPGIYGAASAFLSAKRLGHTVRIAEKHYAGVLAGLPGEARTLEAVMGIEELAAKIVRRAAGRSAP